MCEREGGKEEEFVWMEAAEKSGGEREKYSLE